MYFDFETATKHSTEHGSFLYFHLQMLAGKNEVRRGRQAGVVAVGTLKVSKYCTS